VGFVAACVQLCTGSKVSENLESLEAGILQAARLGASLVATPENSTFLGPSEEKVALAESLDGPTHQRLGKLARSLGIHLLIGSVAEISPVPGRCYNTSLLFGPNGEMIGFYRKIHLFDVDIPGGTRFLESSTITPGKEVVVVPTALGKIGLSICYDLRFPWLYQRLVEKGAEILTIPSAFTRETGKDHWHPLLRARATECQSFVLAPAQEGKHDDRGIRNSFGHSLIVDPWGVVLAECADGVGVAIAVVEPERLLKIRAAMPVQLHQQQALSRNTGSL
jgi:predicted amidohydrolase